MKRSPFVSQSSVARLIKAADEAWRRKDLKQSIEILERANRLDPANVTVLLQLGRYHGLNYNYTAAENCFERAVRVSSKKTETLTMAGDHCRDFRNLDLALRYSQRAAEQPDATPEALVQLAEFYERVRRVGDASALVERALKMHGGCGVALLARARLERQAGRLDEAEKAVRSVLSQPDPGIAPSQIRDTRIRAWYELGAVLDRQKRFDEAMAAFVQAKSMVRLHAVQQIADLKVVRGRLAEMRDSLKPELFQKWSELGAQLQPARRLALLAGHPRSGTTLLEQVLDSHPDIVSAEETEIFHDDACAPLRSGFPDNMGMLPILEAAGVDTLRQARAKYFQAMDLSLGKPFGERLLIDKNPSYTFVIVPLMRIFPEMKLLVALRDPRDVVLSCFMQTFVPVGNTTSAFLSLEGAANEYAALMGMWTVAKPMIQNPWLEVRYEDMVDDLESVARRVLEFLGVPWDERVLRFDEHARQKIVRSPTYADVTKPVFKTAMGRWRNYEKYLEPHLEKLEPFVKAFGYA